MAELGAGNGSDYPGTLDTDSSQESTSTSARANVPNDLAAAIIAIQGELGTTPSGSKATVKERIDVDHEANGTHSASLTLTTPTIASFANANHPHDDAAGGGLIDMAVNMPYIKLFDSKATTTDGGTFTQGAWQKRTVTEDQDTGSNVAVASSVIVLAAGDYDCLIRCPAYQVNLHQTRLRNTSGATTLIVGSNSRSDAGSGIINDSIIQGRFTIAGSQNVEIQHQCQTTRNADGFGLASDFGENEIYTTAEFWKVG